MYALSTSVADHSRATCAAFVLDTNKFCRTIAATFTVSNKAGNGAIVSVVLILFERLEGFFVS